MNSRAYYMTTFGAWRRSAHLCAHSHWAAAEPSLAPNSMTDATPLLVLVEADEGAHLALEKNPEFEALPPVLSASPVPENVATALARYGVLRGATTLDVTQAVARIHPLMRYRVF